LVEEVFDFIILFFTTALDFLCRAPRHSPLHATGKLRTHFNDASEVCPQFVMAAKMLKENIKRIKFI
jgi:hypothetical protein